MGRRRRQRQFRLARASPAAFGGLQVGYQCPGGTLGARRRGRSPRRRHLRQARTASSITSSPACTATVDTKNSVGWFGTLRPRIGYAWDRTLLYATGGVAFGSIKHSFHFTDNFNFAAQDERQLLAGWLRGRRWRRAQVLTAFEHQGRVSIHRSRLAATIRRRCSSSLPACLLQPHSRRTPRSQTDFHTVRVGLNYRVPRP